MKWQALADAMIAQGSCPARGTWIEILRRKINGLSGWSCPARGTWIEMWVIVVVVVVVSVVPRKGHVD